MRGFCYLQDSKYEGAMKVPFTRSSYHGITTSLVQESPAGSSTSRLHSRHDYDMGGQRIQMTEFRHLLQVQSHLEMPGILVQLGHIQHT